MRVTPAPVWNYLFPDSPFSILQKKSKRICGHIYESPDEK